MALPPPELFETIYRQHGHRCPMSTLGGRLGFAAAAHLPAGAPLQAVYGIATCAADGIGVATGCRTLDGSLSIRDRGRHCLWLSSADGGGIRAELTENALLLAGSYRILDLALERERVLLTAAEWTARHDAKEAFLSALLQQLWQLPDSELLRLDETPPDFAGDTDG